MAKREDKVTAYPGMDTKLKLTAMAKSQNRKISAMASIILMQAVKDVKLEEGK